MYEKIVLRYAKEKKQSLKNVTSALHIKNDEL